MSSDDEFTGQSKGKYRGPEHASPYPVSRLAAPIDLVDVAREIQKAEQSLQSHVSAKLEIIVEQMRHLKAQAERIMTEAQRDSELHRAKCQFQKRPGHVYHLYKKPNGDTYLSMLSAADWKGEPPHEPLGSYRLEADMSWTAAGEIDAREAANEDVKRLLGD